MIWQHDARVLALREDRQRFGGWALIIHALRMLRAADLFPMAAGLDSPENVEKLIDAKLAEHGPPPEPFKRAYLECTVRTYAYLEKNPLNEEDLQHCRRNRVTAETLLGELCPQPLGGEG